MSVYAWTTFAFYLLNMLSPAPPVPVSHLILGAGRSRQVLASSPSNESRRISVTGQCLASILPWSETLTYYYYTGAFSVCLFLFSPPQMSDHYCFYQWGSVSLDQLRNAVHSAVTHAHTQVSVRFMSLKLYFKQSGWNLTYGWQTND